MRLVFFRELNSLVCTSKLIKLVCLEKLKYIYAGAIQAVSITPKLINTKEKPEILHMKCLDHIRKGMHWPFDVAPFQKLSGQETDTYPINTFNADLSVKDNPILIWSIAVFVSMTGSKYIVIDTTSAAYTI